MKRTKTEKTFLEKYLRAIIILFVAIGMIAEIFTKTYYFYGVGVGMLLLWCIEEVSCK